MKGEWKEKRLKSLAGARHMELYGPQYGFQVGSLRRILSRKVMYLKLIYAFEKSFWLFCASWTLGKSMEEEELVRGLLH